MKDKILTKEQKMAQTAWASVEKRKADKGAFDEYTSFALAFPALIHSCGLVQAVAFAQAKDRGEYLKDLEAVFNMVDHTDGLAKQSREAGLAEYSRISRHALAAASWIKRYCQTLDNEAKGGMSLAKLP